MDFTTLISFTFIASLLVMSPGPNGVLIAKTVPTSGKAAGFANVAGFVAAFYLHGALSILGISVILVQSAQAFFIVKMLGAAYLCWIGIKALRNAWSGISAVQDIVPAKKQRTLLRAFVEGFLTNALNPKVSMFYLAAFPQFISQSSGAQGAFGASFTLVFVHSMLNLVWFSAMVLLFSRLSGATRSRTFQRWLKGVTGVVFIGFGAKLATLKL
ncbi:MAG: LysE family translocator [Rhizobiaceae bacterium]|nr:LysE family translocator [Rhizobiaceae bacterium]